MSPGRKYEVCFQSNDDVSIHVLDSSTCSYIVLVNRVHVQYHIHVHVYVHVHVHIYI